ncbi:tetratricopeptide repeat protein [Parasphingorhabdus pacifica]
MASGQESGEEPVEVGNALNGEVRSALQAGQVNGPVTFYGSGAEPDRGPGLGSVEAPMPVHGVHGRDDVVAAVTGELRTGRSCVVLYAAGGYGKTTIASRVVREAADDTEVWWVDASSEHGLSEALREVATRAGANPEAVRQAWEGGASAPDLLWRQLDRLECRWLLVFDNADDARVLGAGRPVPEGTGWLRVPGSRGSVLVTSRDGNPAAWGGRVSLRAVESLPEVAGARLLLERAPEAGSAERAEELSRRLGGLPLALHSAGRYLAVAGAMPILPGLELPVDFDSYRDALDGRWPELTELPDSPHPPREREMLHRTWELSLDLLAERGHPLARPLLRLVSHLAAAPIPLELLRADVLAEHPPFASLTPQRLAATIQALAGVGLAESTTLPAQDVRSAVPVLRLHPVVRETNRHHGDVAERRAYAGRCSVLLAGVASGIDPADPVTWPRWRILLPHCAAIADAVIPDAAPGGDGPAGDEPAGDEGELGPVAEATATAAGFCAEAGLLAQAARLYRAALSCCRATFGAEHPATLGIRNNLANVLLDRGELAIAESEFRAVLESATEVLGVKDPRTLSALANLARVLNERGELAQAESKFGAVLELRREVLGAEHPDVLITRNNLANLLRERGDLDRAEAEYRTVLESATELWGPEHHTTLGVRNNLANVSHLRGELDRAEAEYSAILESATEMWGREHPNTLRMRGNWASVLKARGDLERAVTESRALLELQRATLGDGHSGTLATRSNLATLLRDLGEPAEAESELRPALESTRRLRGENHPSTLTMRHNRAVLLRDRGELDQAEVEFHAVWTARCEVLGGKHPDTRATKAELDGLLAHRQGDPGTGPAD